MDSFRLVKITQLPSSTSTLEWYFPKNSVMFPFSTGKNAFKAKTGSESSKGFIQSIYYERFSAALAMGWSEGGSPSRPKAEQQTKATLPQGEETRGQKDAGLVPRGVGICSHQTTKLSRNIITSTCASLKTQRVFFLPRLTAHTE